MGQIAVHGEEKVFFKQSNCVMHQVNRLKEYEDSAQSCQCGVRENSSGLLKRVKEYRIAKIQPILIMASVGGSWGGTWLLLRFQNAGPNILVLPCLSCLVLTLYSYIKFDR